MTELIYSTTRVRDAGDCRVLNPRLFQSVVPGATKVTIIGSWPRVERAYRKVGVETEACSAVTDLSRALTKLPSPPAELTTEPEPEVPADATSWFGRAKQLGTEAEARW